MENTNNRKSRKDVFVICCSLIAIFLFSGCAPLGSYSNEMLYPADVQSVYVEMFDNKTYQRGIEYDLTDAVAKRIESETPYKIVTDRNRADTVMSGYVVSVGVSVLSVEQESGRALEKESVLIAVVRWKNLKSGELLIDDREVQASASFSEWQNQGVDYANSLAANKLARKITELMEMQW